MYVRIRLKSFVFNVVSLFFGLLIFQFCLAFSVFVILFYSYTFLWNVVFLELQSENYIGNVYSKPERL